VVRCEGDIEAGRVTSGSGHGQHAVVHHLDAVLLDLGAADPQQLGWRCVLAAEVVVHVPGRCVARLAAVHDQHSSSGPAQRHRPAQPGGTAADHHHVIGIAHGQSLRRSGVIDKQSC